MQCPYPGGQERLCNLVQMIVLEKIVTRQRNVDLLVLEYEHERKRDVSTKKEKTDAGSWFFEENVNR